MQAQARGKAVYRWRLGGTWVLTVYQIVHGRRARLVACFHGVTAAMNAIVLEGDRAPRAIVLGPPGPFEWLEAFVLDADPDWIQLLLVVPRGLKELGRHVQVKEEVKGPMRLVVFRTTLLNDYEVFLGDLDLETLLRIIPEPKEGCKQAIAGRCKRCSKYELTSNAEISCKQAIAGRCNCRRWAFRTALDGLRRDGPLSGLVVVALFTHLADHELLPVDAIHFWHGSRGRLPRIIDLNDESVGIVLPPRRVTRREIWT